MFLTRYSSTPDLFSSMRRELNDAFEQVFGGEFGNGMRRMLPQNDTGYAPLSIWDDDTYVFLEIDVPGVDKDHLDLSFEHNRLWIRGERPVPKGDSKYWRNERMYGRFERWVELPEIVDRDSIDAELHDGVLFVQLTKKPEAQTTKICIKSCDSGQQKLTEEAK